MPALKQQFAADRSALILAGQLIGLKVQGGEQRSDIRVVSHQQRDFRLAGSLAHQRVIDIFNQRFGDVLRHRHRGKQTILIAIFQLRQHLPLLIAGDLPPRHLIFREALADVTAFGIYMGLWYPDVPRWIWILSIIFFIGAMNLCNVRVFGEMEFWLSLVKVVAIIAMMLAGAGIIFFGFGHSFPATGLENLWSHGGFAPNGWQGVIASLGIVMFAFGGVEIIGVTAAEAKDPKKVIPQAINTIPLRIILFYVCTLAVLMAIFPWNSFGEQGSPFVLIFDGLGIPAAATILNIIVISASISAINSDIFGAGRMMYGMSKEGLAPKSFQRIASNGVPWMTVVVMGGALLAAVVLNYLIPEQVFVLIASLAAFATVWVWLMILLSHFAMRRGLSAEERSQIAFPIPFWPVAPLLTLLFMGLVIAVLGMFAETRMALIAGLVWLGLLTVVWYARVRKTALQVATEQ